ncbi:CAP domain-containing protein [Kribbella sp. NPDC004536]|uniref:CAP domain-containing protein n=1 Tax=Kribbella sp. NPDC004536 TaxID=3364106 RepID=UPI0036940066
MTEDELQLFQLIDNARISQGCTPLTRDTHLTNTARADARKGAKSGTVSTDGNRLGAGGDRWTVQQAFDQMMSQDRTTVLNCSLATWGIGFASHSHCKILLCLTGTIDRNMWVAAFR